MCYIKVAVNYLGAFILPILGLGGHVAVTSLKIPVMFFSNSPRRIQDVLLEFALD